jgi:hypothetical protein
MLWPATSCGTCVLGSTLHPAQPPVTTAVLLSEHRTTIRRRTSCFIWYCETRGLRAARSEAYLQPAQYTYCLFTVFSLLSLFWNKKFWEELIAYFPWYDTGHIENDMPNNSSIVACVLVTAVTSPRSRCRATIGGPHRHTQQRISQAYFYFFKIRRVG